MTLQTYLTERFTTIGNQLGWTATEFGFIVSDTLTLLDISAEGEEPNTWKLQRVGEYVLWKRALADVSLDIDVMADGSSYKRSQMHAQIKSNLADAERDVWQWLPSADATIESISGSDPYSYTEERDNAGLW